jgi:hypothetical protein
MVGSDILRSTVAADKVDDDGSDGGIDVDVKTRFAASAMRTLDDSNSRAAMLLLSMVQNCRMRIVLVVCVRVRGVWGTGAGVWRVGGSPR